MSTLPEGCVDMIMCDLPYGTTQCKWDAVIPFDYLWAAYERITKPTTAILLTASQPFTSALLMSQPKWFRHEWIWVKNRGSNFANTVREPMKEHESVLMFCRKTPWTYHRQMQERTGGGLSLIGAKQKDKGGKTENYGAFAGKDIVLSELRVPSSWQKFNCEVGLHPNQKPVGLMEYIIKTYSNEGDTVLDNCMGSGTTGVACKNLNRRFIGIESDVTHFATAKNRIENHEQRIQNNR